MLKKPPTEHDIRVRAYFLYRNRTGRDWANPVSNWIEARDTAREVRYRLPYLIIDQNCLRDRKSVVDARNQAISFGWNILIPDVAFVEMTKSVQWETTLLSSLQFLAEVPQCVALSYGYGELMRDERNSGEFVTDLVDNETTPLLQELLSEIAIGQNGKIRHRFRVQSTSARDLASKQYLQHNVNKNTLEYIANSIRQELSDNEIRKLRADPKKYIEFLSSISMTNTCIMTLTSLGYNERNARILSSEPSVTGYYYIAMAALACDWLLKGGLASADPKKITNDISDLEYVVTGSISAGLVTKDVNMFKRYQELCAVADMKWKWLRELYENNNLPIWD